MDPAPDDPLPRLLVAHQSRRLARLVAPAGGVLALGLGALGHAAPGRCTLVALGAALALIALGAGARTSLDTLDAALRRTGAWLLACGALLARDAAPLGPSLAAPALALVGCTLALVGVARGVQRAGAVARALAVAGRVVVPSRRGLARAWPSVTPFVPSRLCDAVLERPCATSTAPFRAADSARAVASVVADPRAARRWVRAATAAWLVALVLGGGAAALGFAEAHERWLAVPTRFAAGGDSLCLVDRAGRVSCRTGRAASGYERVPGLDRVTDLAVTAGYACARRTDGSVACWGQGYVGQLGTGLYALRARPERVPSLPPARVISAGTFAACAVVRDGAVWCWGSGPVALEHSAAAPRATPAHPIAGVADAVDVAVGPSRACAARRDGRVACWGFEGAPALVAGLDDAIDVVVGTEHDCAIKRDRTVVCWGSYEGSVDPEIATRIEGVSDVVQLEAEGGATCARDAAGRIQCWGSALGPFVGESGSAVARERFAELGLATGNVCARRAGEAPRCWADPREPALDGRALGGEACGADGTARCRCGDDGVGRAACSARGGPSGACECAPRASARERPVARNVVTTGFGPAAPPRPPGPLCTVVTSAPERWYLPGTNPDDELARVLSGTGATSVAPGTRLELLEVTTVVASGERVFRATDTARGVEGLVALPMGDYEPRCPWHEPRELATESADTDRINAGHAWPDDAPAFVRGAVAPTLEAALAPGIAVRDVYARLDLDGDGLEDQLVAVCLVAPDGRACLGRECVAARHTPAGWTATLIPHCRGSLSDEGASWQGTIPASGGALAILGQRLEEGFDSGRGPAGWMYTLYAADRSKWVRPVYTGFAMGSITAAGAFESRQDGGFVVPGFGGRRQALRWNHEHTRLLRVELPRSTPAAAHAR